MTDNRGSEKKYYQQGNGHGANVYIGVELIEVVERFQDIGDYSTRCEASNALARLLKETNFLLQFGPGSEPDLMESEWGGGYFGMDNQG